MTEKPSFTNTKHNNIILVAEDDDISFALIEILLSQEGGNKIIRANTGKEAVEIFQKNPDISLILMDLKMPVMDGYDATREIRKTNKNVPIIAQTAYALAGDDKKALEVGCDDYISKPIKKEKLIEKVQWFLQEH